MAHLHRQKNYWESTFNPSSSPLVNKFDWNTIKSNNGPFECICEGFDDSKLLMGKISDKNFATCDFNGNFESKSTFTFSNCKFTDAHFGWSSWQNFKFQKCTFEKCAFSLTKFIRCQFLDCKFVDISVSSNETIFKRCLIEPSKFIDAIETNLKYPDVLSEKGTSIKYQKYRLSRTKAKIAKNVLLSLKDYGDEDLFVESIKTFSIQYNKYRILESSYFIKSGNSNQRLNHVISIFPRFIEFILIYLFGALNRWGYSMGRVIIVGLALWLLFSVIYFVESKQIANSMIKSFDILTLVGYSKYDISGLTILNKIIYTVNIILGISWFSLLFPTILAKTSNRFE